MATSKNSKLPPGFDEGKSYENWKNEVETWKRGCRSGPATGQQLGGRAEDSGGRGRQTPAALSLLLEKD